MVPSVCIVAQKSNVGKTTLIEKLIKELKNRNYKIATIKHDAHSFDMDKPGKDTWRHREAGSSTVIISSKNRVAILKEVEREWDLDELIELNEDVDLVLIEGYRYSDKPKIEVFRSPASEKLMCTEDELIAVASNIDHSLSDVPVFDINDYIGLVNRIEEVILKKK